MVLPLMIRRARAHTQGTEQSHAELHDGLRKAGQRLTIGHDYTGWSMKFLRQAKGYYLNIGCSEAIINGGVKILDFNRIRRFVEHGVLLDDGTPVPLDVIVPATECHATCRTAARRSSAPRWPTGSVDASGWLKTASTAR